MVFGPCDRLRLQNTSQGVVYITQAHLDNLHFFFYFGEWAKRPKNGSECLEVSIKLFSTLLGGVMLSQNLTGEVCVKKYFIKLTHRTERTVLMC